METPLSRRRPSSPMIRYAIIQSANGSAACGESGASVPSRLSSSTENRRLTRATQAMGNDRRTAVVLDPPHERLTRGAINDIAHGGSPAQY